MTYIKHSSEIKIFMIDEMVLQKVHDSPYMWNTTTYVLFSCFIMDEKNLHGLLYWNDYFSPNEKWFTRTLHQA